MNHKIILIFLFALAMVAKANSQSAMDSVLISIEKNNTTLAADRQFWEAQKLEYKTGLSLPNPTVQYEFMVGSPSGAGNQQDFIAVQQFDFPTTYKKRRELAEVKGALSVSSMLTRRQEVLLEAQMICIELVYRNKLSTQFERRKMTLEKLLSDFQIKSDKGDGSILDVNKTRLKLLEISQLQQENTVELQKLQTKLMELNGGIALVFQDTIYPPIPEIESFEQVEKAYEAADPIRQTLQQEKLISEKQLQLSKSWKLPKFEAGYHYQAILGQQFSGIHAGITLPIWEQKYRTESQEAQLLFADLNFKSHLNEHFFEIKSHYDRQAALQKSLEDYQNAFASVSNTALLDKALRLGEITTIEYFMEMSFYQDAFLHYMKTERDYHSAVADLMRYKL